MKRASILDNLSAEQAVLYDALCESGPVKVRAIRSRRRPMPHVVDRALHTQAAALLVAEVNEPARRAVFGIERSLYDNWFPHDAWKSPAQIGRQKTHGQRGPHGNGAGWAHRTRAAQQRINEYHARIAAARTPNEMMKAVYSNTKIENLAYDGGALLKMLGGRR